MWRKFCLWRSFRWGTRGVVWMSLDDHDKAQHCFNKARRWADRAGGY